MSLLPKFTLALAILVTPQVLRGVESPSSDRLVEFKSKEGRFQILLPGKPEHDVVEVGDEKGKQHQYKIGTAEGAYIVSYQDNPNLEGATPQKIQEALEVGRDSLPRLFQGKLLESKSVTLDKKHPGLAFRVSIPQAKGEARCRFYMVGTRLYQILVIGLPEFANSKEAAQVISSFRLLP